MTWPEVVVLLAGVVVVAGILVAVGTAMDTQTQRAEWRDLAQERRLRSAEIERLALLREHLRELQAQQNPPTHRYPADGRCAACPYRSGGPCPPGELPAP